MPKVTSQKKFRYGSVSVLLTVAVVAAAILANAIVTALAMRYGWFLNMNPDYLYPVTDTCYDYLDTYVMTETEAGNKIQFIFCDEEENVLADGTQSMILATARELAEAYPDKVEVSYLNVWENPKIARSYGVSASTDVVVKYKEETRVCNLRDFFTFSVDDNSIPTAYNGEKRFAVADELEKAVNDGLEKADKLKQSILKKAFEGKLVAQNPNDEPASVLLERIKKEQKPTKGKKK